MTIKNALLSVEPLITPGHVSPAEPSFLSFLVYLFHAGRCPAPRLVFVAGLCVATGQHLHRQTQVALPLPPAALDVDYPTEQFQRRDPAGGPSQSLKRCRHDGNITRFGRVKHVERDLPQEV